MTKSGLLRAEADCAIVVDRAWVEDQRDRLLPLGKPLAGAGPFHEADRPERGAFTDLLQELVEPGETVACGDVYTGWLEVDTFADYQRAWAAIKS